MKFIHRDTEVEPNIKRNSSYRSQLVAKDLSYVGSIYVGSNSSATVKAGKKNEHYISRTDYQSNKKVIDSSNLKRRTG